MLDNERVLVGKVEEDRLKRRERQRERKKKDMYKVNDDNN